MVTHPRIRRSPLKRKARDENVRIFHIYSHKDSLSYTEMNYSDHKNYSDPLNIMFSGLSLLRCLYIRLIMTPEYFPASYI